LELRRDLQSSDLELRGRTPWECPKSSLEEADPANFAGHFGDTEKWPKTYIYIYMYVERGFQGVPKKLHIERV